MTQLMTDEGRIVRVPAGTWKVDPAHSSVGFEVKHMMISTVRGQFREFDGTLEAAEDDPAHSRAWGSVKVASIDTGNAERDEHLRSPDFFDADRYPEIRFESTRVAHVEGGTYNVWGDSRSRTSRARWRSTATVEGAGQDPWGIERVGIAIRGEIDRTEFGLRWQQKLTTGGLLIGENVKVLADVSAVRA